MSGHPGPETGLTGNKRCPARRAALLAVRGRKAHALIRNAIDIGCSIAHQAIAVTTEIRDADIVAPNNQNIWFLRLGHDQLLFMTLLQLRKAWLGCAYKRSDKRVNSDGSYNGSNQE